MRACVCVLFIITKNIMVNQFKNLVVYGNSSGLTLGLRSFWHTCTRGCLTFPERKTGVGVCVAKLGHFECKWALLP